MLRRPELTRSCNDSLGIVQPHRTQDRGQLPVGQGTQLRRADEQVPGTRISGCLPQLGDGGFGVTCGILGLAPGGEPFLDGHDNELFHILILIGCASRQA
jgi:hypothetical protein